MLGVHPHKCSAVPLGLVGELGRDDAQDCCAMERLRPDLADTFRPGLSTVPRAERVMLATFRSSTAIRSWLCTNSVVIWWQSLRFLTVSRCLRRASRARSLRWFLEFFRQRAMCLWRSATLASSDRRFSTKVLSESAMREATPMSRSTARPVFGSCSTSTS